MGKKRTGTPSPVGHSTTTGKGPRPIPRGARLFLEDGTECTLVTEGYFDAKTNTYSAIVMPSRVIEFGAMFSPGRLDWSALRLGCAAAPEGDENMPIDLLQVKCDWCGAAPGQPCVPREGFSLPAPVDGHRLRQVTGQESERTGHPPATPAEDLLDPSLWGEAPAAASPEVASPDADLLF